MIRSNSNWVAGSYQWNDEQTDAFLTENGKDLPLAWIDSAGNVRNIRYQIPAVSECATCHHAGAETLPIGFKVRNLNIEVKKKGNTSNQLLNFAKEGLMNDLNPAAFSQLPDWRDKTASLESRARAYLDVNCAHCHQDGGYCSKSSLRMDYETPFEATKISERKKQIDRFMSGKKMPLTGTTVIDQEGLAMIKEYITSLK